MSGTEKKHLFWWGHDRKKWFITKHQGEQDFSLQPFRSFCLKCWSKYWRSVVALDAYNTNLIHFFFISRVSFPSLSGLDAIHYEEHLDYEVLQSTHADLNKAVVRVNLFKEHRQTVQYVEPHDCARLAQVRVCAVRNKSSACCRWKLGNFLSYLSFRRTIIFDFTMT